MRHILAVSVLVATGAPGPAPSVAQELEVAKLEIVLDAARKVKMEFVRIKAGTFTMGDPASVYGGVKNAPEHEVTLTKNYWMQTTETTRAQWQAVMGGDAGEAKAGDLPMDDVSWNDCKAFMEKLNEKAKDSLKGRKAGLPTEAEWEHACRAGTRTPWSFGDDASRIGDYAWRLAKLHPVGLKKPNAWGLHDMHGNAWERCEDWYGDYGGKAKDPAGPDRHRTRCLRGGSCIDLLDDFNRSGWRFQVLPDHHTPGSGFRTALH